MYTLTAVSAYFSRRSKTKCTFTLTRVHVFSHCFYRFSLRFQHPFRNKYAFPGGLSALSPRRRWDLNDHFLLPKWYFWRLAMPCFGPWSKKCFGPLRNAYFFSPVIPFWEGVGRSVAAWFIQGSSGVLWGHFGVILVSGGALGRQEVSGSKNDEFLDPMPTKQQSKNIWFFQ